MLNYLHPNPDYEEEFIKTWPQILAKKLNGKASPQVLEQYSQRHQTICAKHASASSLVDAPIAIVDQRLKNLEECAGEFKKLFDMGFSPAAYELSKVYTDILQCYWAKLHIYKQGYDRRGFPWISSGQPMAFHSMQDIHDFQQMQHYKNAALKSRGQWINTKLTFYIDCANKGLIPLVTAVKLLKSFGFEGLDAEHQDDVSRRCKEFVDSVKKQVGDRTSNVKNLLQQSPLFSSANLVEGIVNLIAEYECPRPH